MAYGMSLRRWGGIRARLLWIRCGPGALTLPKEITKIRMEYNTKIYGGHQGARKFWRDMLPRIKYRNPAIPIEVARHKDPSGPSLLHIYMKSAAASTSTSTSPPTPTPSDEAQTADDNKPTHSINIKDQVEHEILEAFIAKTGAMEIRPSAQEVQEIAEIKEFKERSDADRVMVREKLLAERREAELLKLARGELSEVN
ncbi:hypothetical protein P153DRAFT_395319 [Dothidotthia symphoricarpi CBS 119687]|uniref:Ribosomal protein/NADH dehydrogenase domain-containing protein n=1 Tax=Dothidotthia symphoricarpi CBS 119687 TaxID=1392245 RepID=A0A6A6AH85_9PLEO|nr:uncharacterized protein P153DRAFT_395319 [Dothidotthia symphoricarpi CBS 119687]KAF2130916.1 hypothetical protein P153DRAFT_395319 [Dothidotthia symphoricarpi CBS 119687]